MPHNESFWNPYRWVSVSASPVRRKTPQYRHRWHGNSGRLECRLEALTPLFVGSSREDGHFIRDSRLEYFIPATTLKGLIRSLVELVGNSAVPFQGSRSDPDHDFLEAASSSGGAWQLDVASRMFGYCHRGQVFSGLVRFSDARLASDGQPDDYRRPLGPFRVVVGQPRPDSHTVFYPDAARRKFYHHHHNNPNQLIEAPSSITQVRAVRPLRPGVKFNFLVDFENLDDEELSVLLYCITLEEEVTVQLSSAALGPGQQTAAQITGPMRHKVGGCKPHGAGSVRIDITRFVLYADMASRYRSGDKQHQVELTEQALGDELKRRTEPIRRRTDRTMQELRAMLIYSKEDPRKNIHYPDYSWFRNPNNGSVPLKPTL